MTPTSVRHRSTTVDLGCAVARATLLAGRTLNLRDTGKAPSLMTTGDGKEVRIDLRQPEKHGTIAAAMHSFPVR